MFYTFDDINCSKAVTKRIKQCDVKPNFSCISPCYLYLTYDTTCSTAIFINGPKEP